MIILARKIISASVSGALFAILFGLIYSDPFGATEFVSSVPIYMLYSFPAILFYGVITSIISDKIGEFLSIKSGNAKAEIIVSGALHIVFGLVLLWISLGASILFFMTDRVLRRRNKTYTWLEAIKSLAIPLLVWLIFMGIIWGRDIFAV